MNLRRSARILARTSPSIKRSDPGDTTDTVSSSQAGVQPNPVTTNTSYVQSEDPGFQYKNSDLYKVVRPCSVTLHDILDYDDTEQHCTISQCKTKNCKTCAILITDTYFTSDLTKKTFNTRSYDDLNCKSTNIVYGLECNLCGLIYVGETKGRLNKRICGHRSGINNNLFPTVYHHFNQPDHSILSMKVRILEKIYHPSNSPNLSTPLRRQKEEYWIRKLGTAIPYGCNDKIDSIGNLSSPRCNNVNVMNIFDNTPRRKRSHGHRHYTSPQLHDVSINGLLPFVQKPLGMHHIRTKLYSLPLTKLNSLYKTCLENPVTDSSSTLYKLVAVILDIGHHRLFKPVEARGNEKENRSFLPLYFANKGLDAINLGNILHHKSVRSKVPPYFKDQSVPIISYTYTSTIAPKIFNYRRVLQNLSINDLKAKPPGCSCEHSPFSIVQLATLSQEI